MDPQADVVTLPDGRALGFHEFGDPAGSPCLYIPGTPSSGLAGLAYDAAARAVGVRLIGVDKPGYGISSMTPRRTMAAFGEDVRGLADLLGLDEFRLFGESGGGPQALAAAALVGNRVPLTVVAAGMGMLDERVLLAAMRPSNRRLLRVARRAPILLRPPMALTRRSLLDPKRCAAFVKRQLAESGPADRRAIEQMTAQFDITAAARDALRTGTRAVAAELRMLARPWDVDIAGVAGRVELWHGSDDVNVPPAVALSLARRLPNAVAHVLPGEGHAVGWSQRETIMASLAHVGSAA